MARIVALDLQVVLQVKVVADVLAQYARRMSHVGPIHAKTGAHTTQANSMNVRSARKGYTLNSITTTETKNLSTIMLDSFCAQVATVM